MFVEHLPKIVEAHGKRWIALYRASTTVDHVAYIAVEASGEDFSRSLPCPAPCFLILEDRLPDVGNK